MESFLNTPGTELRQMPAPVRHHATAVGITEVIKEDYSSLCAKSSGFSKHVPESAYAYYVGAHT